MTELLSWIALDCTGEHNVVADLQIYINKYMYMLTRFLSGFNVTVIEWLLYLVSFLSL